MSNDLRMPPIAITGVGALFPGDAGPNGFWKTIISGRDCISDIPSQHWLVDDYYDPDPAAPGKTYARRGAFISPVDFDPIEHGIPPNLLASTDTAQLLALIVAKRVLESCGDLRHIDKDRIAVILGVASATELVSTMSGSLQRPIIEKTLRASGLPEKQITPILDRISQCYVDWTESTFPGLLGNVVAGRIANRFDFGGMNCVIDAACASSLGALKLAIDELWTGAADMVITGGVDAINDIFMYMCFSKTLAMSRSGDCRPFSEDADGTMLGEGIGMFALRRLEDAERDGDCIYAVLRGIGASSDGRAKSIYAPRPEGQSKALRRAYATAGYDPSTVELMEAHGTGTVAGDAAEVAALKDVFGESGRTDGSWCALGSIKSQIGHTKAAAGSASLYKAVMALRHKVLPPTLKIRQPNPALQLNDSPFYLNSEARPWVRAGDHPRRASVSSFGFGGSNFHLTLEEYTGTAPQPPRIRTLQSELFLIGAESASSIVEKARVVAQESAQADGFSSAAYRSQREFNFSSNCRLAIVASSSDDFRSKVERAASLLQKSTDSFALPIGIVYGAGAPITGKLAFLFPGQGSQYLGMTAGLTMAFDAAREKWDLAADLGAIVFPPPGGDRSALAAHLTDTRNAQPAIGIASWVYLNLLQHAGLNPDLCTGHSFGEVTALFAAGALSSADFVAIARQRGALMAEAASSTSGAMAAVACGAAELVRNLSALGAGLVVANVNSPKQTVIAGPADLIDKAVASLSAQGKIARRLPVSTAFHSPIVESAAVPFAQFLNSVSFLAPAVPVFSNTTGQSYPSEPNAIRSLLGMQLARPVQFAEEIANLYDAGARIFIEVGPGAVLTELVGACLDSKPHLAVSTDTKGQDAVTALWMAFAKLAAAGVAVNLDFAWREYMTADLPVKRSAATVALSGANFGKKYPAEIQPFALPQAVVETPLPSSPSLSSSSVQLIQEKMAEAHAAAQRAIADSHLAYLKASELALTSILGGSVSIPEPAFLAPVVEPPVMPAARPVVEVKPPAMPKEIPMAPVTVAPVSESLDRLVLTVIADQTGYPIDILTPDMDLEADLGIDSIKRVQILAAVSEKRPDLPPIETSAMAGIRTIGAVIRHLSGSSAPATQTPLPAASLRRVALQEVQVTESGTAAPLFAKGDKFAIVGCNDGVGVALARALSERGVDAKVLPQIPPDVRGAVLLDLEDDAVHDPVGHARRVFSAAQEFAQSKGAQGGAFIAVQARGSSMRSGMTALVRTLALEHPGCIVRSIELDRADRSPADLARIVAEEMNSTGENRALIVRAGGERAVLQDVEKPIQSEPDHSLLSGNPVIVASGGARGVTAACLLAAAKIAPLRVALLGRTPLISEPSEIAGVADDGLKSAILTAARARGESVTPREIEARVRSIRNNREVAATLQSFRDLGSEVVYLNLDVTDHPATVQAIQEVRTKWGRIDMLVHGAGVIADKRIAEKSPEQFAQVFATKVLGARSLLQATAGDALRFICIFSSVAGRYGNAGQADYAMANAVLNAIAKDEAARRNGCVVRSLNWGPWDGGMVTPELRRHFSQNGIPVISMQDGVSAFVRELQYKSSDPTDVDVVLAARG